MLPEIIRIGVGYICLGILVVAFVIIAAELFGDTGPNPEPEEDGPWGSRVTIVPPVDDHRYFGGSLTEAERKDRETTGG